MRVETTRYRRGLQIKLDVRKGEEEYYSASQKRREFPCLQALLRFPKQISQETPRPRFARVSVPDRTLSLQLVADQGEAQKKDTAPGRVRWAEQP